ncbi:MAG: ABC transporter substrate-binding protein [Lachnospiraceae bacterium]|nr:ABC transporter substrate-binding protein [Lachnospiraceae bacterium]
MKKHIKGLVSLALCGAMATGMFTGCGASAKGKGSNGKVELTLFTGKIETIDSMNDIIDDFNASQDRIKVTQEYQKDASSVIKVKFAANEAPDIMTTYEQEYADSGKYMDLSGQKQWWDRLNPEMKDMCTDVGTGKQYRVCTNTTNAGFFYNKEILKSVGYDKFPETYDEFHDMLTKIKDKGITPWFIFGSEAWHLGHLIEFIPHGYIKQKYGTIDAKKAMLDNDKDKLQYGDPNGAMATFAKNLVQLKDEGLINKDVLTATSDNCVQDFVNGKTAMLSNGMWVLSSLQEADPKIASKIGFAAYPSYMEDMKPVVLNAEDSGYCISANTKHKKECIEFLNYLFKAKNQKKYCEAAGSPSAFKDVDAKWAPENIVKQVKDVTENSVNIGYTNEKPAGFSGDDAGRLVQNLLDGQYSPEKFAKEYEDAWNAGIK